jgi:ribonuclease P protein component
LDISWRANDLGHPRLGVVVPRHGHTVVERNRLRRRLREITRRRVLRDLGPLDVVIRSRTAAYAAGFQDLAGDLARWLRSLSS